MRSIKSFLSLETIKMVYFSYVKSLLTYGRNSWGTSSHVISVFKIKKQIIRIMTNSVSKDSCRDLFKQLNILPLQSQYIYSISVFVVMNRGLFILNCDVHNIQTRQKVWSGAIPSQCAREQLYLYPTTYVLIYLQIILSTVLYIMYRMDTDALHYACVDALSENHWF
jgi:hypothetical protein